MKNRIEVTKKKEGEYRDRHSVQFRGRKGELKKNLYLLRI